MKPPRRSIFLIVPIAILLLPLAIYGADRATSTEEVARNVTIDEIPVGGLTVADATLAVQAREQALRQSTGVFTVNGSTFKLSPVAIDVTTDTDGAIADAMAARRDGNVFENFMSWIRSFSSTEDVTLSVGMSDDAIDAHLADWEEQAIPDAAYEGAVDVVDGAVVPDYPRTGQTIDGSAALSAIQAEMSSLDKAGVDLPVIVSTPALTGRDIDDTVALIERMIDSEVVLRSTDVGFRTTFSANQLASAAASRLSSSGDSLEVYFDVTRVLEILEPRRGEYEFVPIDARFDIDIETDEISVIPGRSGTLLDVPSLLRELVDAALGDGSGTFPIIVGAEPEFTTEDAQALTSLERLSLFTTEHPARQDRVVNIQQMARDVDGVVVLPGHEWSINEHVGQRTEANGYVAAPAIINGEPYCCDHPANIGGGVSQFGTTMFNAVFYACLEDVEHRPHSLHFTRYPEGLEATLGFPGPDVRFKNDTDSPVIITTAYTDTSITVAMYGDNGGLECTSETSEREAIVEFETEYTADTEDTLLPGQQVKERSGIDGFLVRVTRVITHPDGAVEREDPLVWRYATLSELYTVHRCETSGEPVNCPTTLPNLVGSTWAGALETLQAQGLLAARADSPVDDSSQDGVVIAQDPPSGEWVNAGATITLTVGVYSGGDEG